MDQAWQAPHVTDSQPCTDRMSHQPSPPAVAPVVDRPVDPGQHFGHFGQASLLHSLHSAARSMEAQTPSDQSQCTTPPPRLHPAASLPAPDCSASHPPNELAAMPDMTSMEADGEMLEALQWLAQGGATRGP